jgi:hypothetical protein
VSCTITPHVALRPWTSNANAIRDLIVERLRQYRDSGLGDTPHPAASSQASKIAAARAVLEEARALHAAVAAGQAFSDLTRHYDARAARRLPNSHHVNLSLI